MKNEFNDERGAENFEDFFEQVPEAVKEAVKESIYWRARPGESGIRTPDEVFYADIRNKLSFLDDKQADVVIDRVVKLLESEPEYQAALKEAERIKKWNREQVRKRTLQEQEEMGKFGAEVVEQEEDRQEAQVAARAELDEQWEAFVPEDKPKIETLQKKSVEAEPKKSWWQFWK